MGTGEADERRYAHELEMATVRAVLYGVPKFCVVTSRKDVAARWAQEAGLDPNTMVVLTGTADLPKLYGTTNLPYAIVGPQPEPSQKALIMGALASHGARRMLRPNRSLPYR